MNFQRSISPKFQPLHIDQAMISEQNTALSLGVDVKLVVHQEDEQDRQVRLWISVWMGGGG